MCFVLQRHLNGSWRRGGGKCFRIRPNGTTTIYIAGLPAGSRWRLRAQFPSHPTILGDETPWSLFLVTR